MKSKISASILIFLAFSLNSFAENKTLNETNVSCEFNFAYKSNHPESSTEEELLITTTLQNDQYETKTLYNSIHYSLVLKTSELNAKNERTYEVYLIDDLSIQTLLQTKVTGDLKSLNFTPFLNSGTYSTTNGLNELTHFDLNCSFK